MGTYVCYRDNRKRMFKTNHIDTSFFAENLHNELHAALCDVPKQKAIDIPNTN